jgi:hypothetical protein
MLQTKKTILLQPAFNGGVNKSNVIHSEFTRIINPLKISSAIAKYAAKRSKKMLRQTSIGGKANNNNLLV